MSKSAWVFDVTEADFEEDEQERENHRDLFAFLKRKEQPAG